MPPRKSNLSQTAITGDEGTPSKDKERDGVNIEDLSLPRTMVQRLAKGVIPANTQIQKDAITAMSKSATLFVNYLAHAYVNPPSHVPQSPSPKKGPRSTAHTTHNAFSAQPINKNRANTSPAMGNRKTISPEAVLDALSELEFDNFLPRVQAELRRFSELQTGKRNDYRRKLKEKEENGIVGATRGLKVAENGHGDDDKDDGDERAAKRVRRDNDELVTDAPSIPRKKVDIVGNVNDAKEEEEHEEEVVEEAREAEDQSEEEDEESDLPADENVEDEVTKEDGGEDGSAGLEVGKLFGVEDEEDEEEDEDEADHDTSVVDIRTSEEEDDEDHDTSVVDIRTSEEEDDEDHDTSVVDIRSSEEEDGSSEDGE